MVDEIDKAMTRLDTPLEGEVLQSYTDYQSETFKKCKDVVKHAQELVLKSSSNPNDMASTSRLLTDTYSQLVDDTRGALATVDSAPLTTQLHTAALNLGTASKDIIHSAANVQGNPEDQPSKKALSDAARVVTEKVGGAC